MRVPPIDPFDVTEQSLFENSAANVACCVQRAELLGGPLRSAVETWEEIQKVDGN